MLENIDWAKDQGATGGFGNTVLYRMVAENPRHDVPGVIKGKMLIIGRVYSAAVTRGAGEKNNENTNLADNLYDHLAKTIMKKHKAIDECIGECNNMGRASSSNIRYIIETHSFLNGIIVDGINKWRKEGNREVNNRTSFTSKYLHFHAPMAFFILDSIVQKKLQENGAKGKRTNWPKDCGPKHHTQYGNHCLRMLEYIREKKYDDNWTPRLIDGHLMGYIQAGRPKSKRPRNCP